MNLCRSFYLLFFLRITHKFSRGRVPPLVCPGSSPCFPLIEHAYLTSYFPRMVFVQNDCIDHASFTPPLFRLCNDHPPPPPPPLSTIPHPTVRDTPVFQPDDSTSSPSPSVGWFPLSGVATNPRHPLPPPPPHPPPPSPFPPPPPPPPPPFHLHPNLGTCFPRKFPSLVSSGLRAVG